jgi:hypothetical protein
MITTRIATALAVGGLAVGILTGSAGTIVLREATTPNDVVSTAHMGQMGSMMSMMSGGSDMMGGSSGMMNGQDGTGPAPSSMPDWMQQHHVTSSPEPTR